ncbi:MAG: class I SAM-dependent methyltransferase [Promethearchaeota archaeon]
MLKLKNIISKHTTFVRYKLISMLIKYMTPRLHQVMDIINLIRSLNPAFEDNIISRTPRPSILMMKQYFFNSNSLIGAEIGVMKGNNSISILKELNISKLYLIDIWDEYEEVQTNFDNLKNYEYVLNQFKNNERVEIIKAFSHEASKKFENKSLDFVYVDANHKYKFIYQDLECWYPKVKNGGIMAGHDLFNAIGVLNAVKDWCFKHKIIFNINPPDWYFIKTGS